ncbi:MAG: hypothetical protein N4A53_01850 [Pelagimonas sp.]|jgi:hypothetical protein|nr:hypothetical protein [Pelagimonas sp.]
MAFLVFLADAAHALPGQAAERARDFATCLGRYAAEMDHHRILGRDPSEAIQRYTTFRTLLDAVQPDAVADGLPARRLLAYRSGAKEAQARLLHQAQYSFDARRARHAMALARQHLASCDRLFLGA